MQIDELDLAWEDDTDRGRHRRRAARQRAKGRKKSRRGRSLLALLISLLVLGALAAGGWYGIDKIQGFFVAPDYTTGGSGEVTVEILDGQTATDIGQTLQKADVVKSAKAFVNVAKSDERSMGIQPGFYKLRLKMRAVDALQLLLDPASRVVSKVTLPEGLTYMDTFVTLAEATKIPVAEFEAAAKDPVALGIPEFWFTRKDGKPVQKSIEGFLYPATYELNPGVDAKTVLKEVIAKFNAEMTSTGFVDKVQQNLHISPFEALIVASIAQVEGKYPEDQANIARVMYNRAYGGKFPCACLQVDAAVNYWLRLQGKSIKESQDLRMSELHNPNNPYNTHDKPGLPVGPISNPGNASLIGAMSPPKNDYLYFVTVDKEGHNNFAVTYQQHLANIALAKKNGVM